jgi:hypothetical protein
MASRSPVKDTVVRSRLHIERVKFSNDFDAGSVQRDELVAHLGQKRVDVIDLTRIIRDAWWSDAKERQSSNRSKTPRRSPFGAEVAAKRPARAAGRWKFGRERSLKEVQSAISERI